MTERTCTESFRVAADQLVGFLKKLVHEGNVRRVIIKQDGRSVVEFPLTVGVIGTVFAPMLAAAGALAAVVSECTIEVERTASARPEERRGPREVPRDPPSVQPEEF
jgi:Domain of unknown function (DUF4342)